jgi:hypothetical protein
MLGLIISRKGNITFAAIKQKIDDKKPDKLNIVSSNDINITIDLKESLKTLITITCALEDKRIKCIEFIKDKRPEAIVLPSLYCAHCYNIPNQCHNTTDCFHCRYCLSPDHLVQNCVELALKKGKKPITKVVKEVKKSTERFNNFLREGDFSRKAHWREKFEKDDKPVVGFDDLNKYKVLFFFLKIIVYHLFCLIMI